MKSRLFGVALLVAVVLVSPICNVEACGPDFEPDVFVRTTIPDDPASFAAGHLGILQAGYDSNEYAVAFRYLNGGKVSAKEQSELQPPSPDPDFEAAGQWQAEQAAQKAIAEAQPPTLWLKARAQYAPPPTPAAPAPSIPIDYEGNVVLDESYLNCPSAAFSNATLTLTKRAGVWGAKSKWLAEWIHAQDTVFSNCATRGNAIPAQASGDSPALLKADRAYQIASAKFYAGQFEDAAREFAAIAADHSSRWSSWGDYLAARATIRKAFAMGKPANPYGEEIATFDSATMLSAQQMLEGILAQPNPVPSRSIVQNELNFVLIRTDPEKRAAELCAAVAGPAPDPNFSQDMQDLSWLLENHIKIENEPPLLAWVAAWRGSGTAASAYAAWQQNHSFPWLVMAMVKAGPSDAFASDLITEAAKIAPESPAYDTAFYHRIRLLIALNRPDEARALLDKALTAPNLQKPSPKPSSERNAILGERMAVARDFTEFLTYAPRVALETGSEPAVDMRTLCQQRAGLPLYGGKTVPCPELDQPITFDKDATTILNEKTPLSRLLDAANSSVLPPNLRQNIAIAGWTRAVVLDDQKSAANFASVLPKDIGITAASSFGFPAFVAIVSHDGVEPVLDPGIARVASYRQFDDFRDNGWCQLGTINGTQGENAPPSSASPTPPIFTPAEQQQAASEFARLKALPDSSDFLGQRIIDYAKQHPNDPDVPEALALVVRATHYDCRTFDPKAPYDQRPKFSDVGKAAFELLHQHYPKSPWTAKTPYYY